MAPGDTVDVAGYGVTYVGSFTRQESNRTVTGAEVEISRNGRVVGVEEPRINRYETSDRSIATPAVDESLTGDLYLSIQGIDDEGIRLGIWWFPFIWLVWVGGFVTGLAVLWSRLVRRPEREPVTTGRSAADAR